MKSCFNEACVSITNSQFSNIKSYFPLIQIPIYSLIECYKNLISIYKKFEVLETEQNLNLPMVIYKENNYNTIELLNLSKIINMKTRTEIDKFNDILNDWYVYIILLILLILVCIYINFIIYRY